MENEEMIRRAAERLFPQLCGTGYRLTSPFDPVYNCIAWAAGRTTEWWWPIGEVDDKKFWPPGVPQEETIPAFVQAFQTLGYEESPNAEAVVGIEKVALYALNDMPTHAARQLLTGIWTSKLGKSVDIEHVLTGLEGTEYGRVVFVLQRVIVAPSTS
jgi:hypothetical protein